jgi:hypothetical protein
MYSYCCILIARLKYVEFKHWVIMMLIKLVRVRDINRLKHGLNGNLKAHVDETSKFNSSKRKNSRVELT